MLKYLKLIILIFMILSVTVSCDKIRPDVHPDKKGNEKGWYFGCSFKTDW